MFRLCLIICCCTACTPDHVPTNRFHESTKAYSASVRSLNDTITQTLSAPISCNEPRNVHATR